MKIIGLTGGVASGKNFVARIFAKNGATIFDADKIVHDILICDEDSILKVSRHFPQAIIHKKIDRKILGEIVFSDVKKLKILEEIIHPKVRQKYLEFIKNAQLQKQKIVVLNIPLLLERQGYNCHKIISLLIPPSIQKRRFLQRKKNETKANLEKKFTKIIANQMKNKERKEKSDFVIYTGFSKAHTIAQTRKILNFIF